MIVNIPSVMISEFIIDACLHLLCYMVCLCAIAQSEQNQDTFLNIPKIVNMLCVRIWERLVTETGFTSPMIKLLPKESFFGGLIKQISQMFKNVKSGMAELWHTFTGFLSHLTDKDNKKEIDMHLD